MNEVKWVECPDCSDAEWNESDGCLIAEYGLGCETCNDAGVVMVDEN